MNRITNLLSKPLAFIACVACLGIQTFTAFSANVPAGTVTEWGDGVSNPSAVSFPVSVRPLAITAGGFFDLAITDQGVYAWQNHQTFPANVVFPPAVTRIIAIAAGTGHTLVITDDGLYAWGSNGNGELGNGTTANSAVPVKVLFPPTVTQVSAVAAGAYHSLAITDDGVYAWGDNGGAQLGDGTRLDRVLPVKVLFPARVTAVLAIAGGGFHSLAITDDGAYSWGNNTFGQLGNASTTDSVQPTPVLFPPKIAPAHVTAIAGGFWHSLAIGDNSAYGWGYNGNGELGDGTATARFTPVHPMFAKKTSVLMVTGIAAGDMHTLILADGDVYACGNNSNGQLGMTGGTRLNLTKVSAENNVIAISAGYYHSLALH